MSAHRLRMHPEAVPGPRGETALPADIIPIQDARAGPGLAVPGIGCTAGAVTFTPAGDSSPALNCTGDHVVITGPFSETAARILAPLTAEVVGDPPRLPLRNPVVTVMSFHDDEFPGALYPAALGEGAGQAIIAVCRSIISAGLAAALTRLLSDEPACIIPAAAASPSGSPAG